MRGLKEQYRSVGLAQSTQCVGSVGGGAQQDILYRQFSVGSDTRAPGPWDTVNNQYIKSSSSVVDNMININMNLSTRNVLISI